MSDITTEPYLAETDIIDFSDPDIKALAATLAEGCVCDSEIAKKCFEYVRDEIRHSGDYRDNVTTCRASEVLKCGTGWCYAKSHLLAALLRANGIPAGFCYQRLSCSEYKKDKFCLHGLNAVYLKAYGWYRVDARGNKEGVNAQFAPPHEQLAFQLQEDESELPEILSEPLDVVIEALRTRTTYEAMVGNFPDIKETR
jgi:transglutaminase-like putative cysteine protease